ERAVEEMYETVAAEARSDDDLVPSVPVEVTGSNAQAVHRGSERLPGRQDRTRRRTDEAEARISARCFPGDDQAAAAALDVRSGDPHAPGRRAGRAERRAPGGRAGVSGGLGGGREGGHDYLRPPVGVEIARGNADAAVVRAERRELVEQAALPVED